MMAKKKSVTARWFVEPRGKVPNEKIMSELATTCEATEDKIFYNRKDNNGVEHGVVEVSASFIKKIRKDIVSLRENFNIFFQKDDSHPMQLWLIRNKRAITHVKKVAGIAKILVDATISPTSKK